MPPALLAEIRRLASSEDAPAATQIYRQLQKDQRFADALPLTVRTIQDIVREFNAPAAGELWSLAAADPETAAVVLEIVASVIGATEGRKTALTVTEADWCVRIASAAPDLPGWAVYKLARLYLYRVDRDDATADLDAFLAFTPWRSEEFWRRYLDAVASGWIEEAEPLIGPDDLTKHGESRERLGEFMFGDGGLVYALEYQRFLFWQLQPYRPWNAREATERQLKVRSAQFPTWAVPRSDRPADRYAAVPSTPSPNARATRLEHPQMPIVEQHIEKEAERG